MKTEKILYVGELVDALSSLDRTLPVCLEQRVKTGYDEGDIYESVTVNLRVAKEQVTLSPHGLKLVGGW